MLGMFSSFAQERPPIEVYSPKTYGAENQNWAISQAKNKFIYVANNKGLLEYNGSTWHLYPTPNATIMRSVNVIDDVVYTGSYKDFGYWEANEFGALSYHSVAKKLNIEFLEDEEFWNIIGVDNYILFQSLKRIYIYNKVDGSYSKIESETSIYKMFQVEDDVYFQKTKDGIYKIEDGQEKLVSNDPILRDNFLVNIFNHEGSLLIVTEDRGLYKLEDNTLSKWLIPANIVLSDIRVYRSIQLRNGSYILGTISDGILYLSNSGEIEYNLKDIQGLSNNTVHSIFEDSDNNIWLGLENGINCINMNSPFEVYSDRTGTLGTVYASAVFNNYLYLGTNQGLFYKPIDQKVDFSFMEGTQGAVWYLDIIDNSLFCGHNSGTFVIDDIEANKVADILGTWRIKEVPGKENLLLQGNYDGIYVLEKLDGEWGLRNKIKGIDISSKFFEISDSQILVSHEYKGVFKFTVDGLFTEATGVFQDQGVTKGLNSSLTKYRDAIYYSYQEGVFKFDQEQKRFLKDSLLSKSYNGDNYLSGKLISDEDNNRLWLFTEGNLNSITFGGLSLEPKIHKYSYSKYLPRGLTGYENITHIEKNSFLIGTSEGYVIIDLDKLSNKKHQVMISTIYVSDLNNAPKQVVVDSIGVFNSSDNHLNFSYSVSSFDKYTDTEYQYKLDGIYDQWSEWSEASSIQFNNLPFGSYAFNVRAKVGNDILDEMATYQFEIKRPWLLSNTMIAVYVLAVVFFVFVLHNVYKRYYRNQQKKMLERKNKELELKSMENKQQLMHFKNEKLQSDIENKNRELAISTMSLIKKNEFLNKIKNELNNVNDTNKLSPVIDIIDKNLNNTDDWKLFQEAFNNADKDFLKKIKGMHPSLTPNDLRLCAYLRLNLSSKEIAPLLNISPRSVEVKRYRLRKKMNLPHESSLTNHIISL